MENKNVKVPNGYKNTELGVIPEDWEIVQIDQLVNINRESRDPTKNSEESFYYIDIDAVENGTGLIKNPKRLFGKEAPSRARRVIHKDDVIMSTVRPYHKAFALVPQLYDNQICSTGFAVLSCGRNLDPKYLLQFLFSDKVIDQCTSMMAGGQYPALNTTQVSKIKITAPSLPEQQKIASLLSKVDEQIEQTEQIIEKTEILKKGLMQKLLTKGIGHTKFKKTELGDIPKEWSIEKLGVICELITKGTTPTTVGFSYQNTGINFVKIESISASGNFLLNMFSHISEDANNALKRSILKDRDLLFSIAGALGRVAIVNSEILPANTNQALAIIRLKEDQKTDIKYVYFYLKGPQIQKHIDRINVQSAQANLSLENINNFKIALPQKEEQQKIASILSKVDSQIQDNQRYLHKLQELKKGLMQDLLTGKVRVCV